MGRRGKRRLEEPGTDKFLSVNPVNPIEKSEEPRMILDIGPLLLCKLVCRPSKSIRSPYVADIRVDNEIGEEVYLAHAPGLDCAGVMTESSLVYCRDNRSSAKTTKTRFSIQLISDPRSDNLQTLVGYHPQIAEDLTQELISNHLIPELNAYKDISRQVTLGDSRIDFVLKTENVYQILVEVKNVVCCEYLPQISDSKIELSVQASPNKLKKRRVIRQCFVDPSLEYDIYYPPGETNFLEYQEDLPFKCGIFPHGQKKPVLGVVSERAIKHIENMIRLYENQENRVEQAVLLFIINRNDCNGFRPGHECDLLFAQMIRKALNHGVEIIAQQVLWEKEGKAYLGRRLPILIPKSIREEDIDQVHLKAVLSAD